MKNGRKKQEQIHLGAHGEDYGNWMPVSMLWLVGGLAALAAVISLLSFAVFHITALGVVFVIPPFFCWRCSYGSPGSGGSMPSGAAA